MYTHEFKLHSSKKKLQDFELKTCEKTHVN